MSTGEYFLVQPVVKQTPLCILINTVDFTLMFLQARFAVPDNELTALILI